MLETLTTNDRTRVWVIAIGATLLLIGLLPPSIPKTPPSERVDDPDGHLDWDENDLWDDED